jgi:hypothetical protein
VSGSKSKIKGSSFEREISKYLSDLYNASFVRASHSGAYVGGANNHRKSFLSDNQIKSFKGDIIPPDDWKNFNAELKFYADFQFHQLFDESKQLETWIDQLMTASDPDDFNILLMKFNRKGRYVAVQSKTSILHNQQQQTGAWMDLNHVTYSTRVHGAWNIYSFEPFFQKYGYLVKLLSSNQQPTKYSTDTPSYNLLNTI